MQVKLTHRAMMDKHAEGRMAYVNWHAATHLDPTVASISSGN